MDNDKRLEVVASVPTELEAALIVNVLDDHGIPAKAVGGFISGFKAEVPGDVDVVVAHSQLEAARKVLAHINRQMPDQQQDPGLPATENEEPDQSD